MSALRVRSGQMISLADINKDNFHIATKAEFRLIAQPDTAALKWSSLVRMYGLNFASDSGSQYVTDGNRLWRYSDHWGVVRSCNWIISPAPKMITSNVVVSSWEAAMATGFLSGWPAQGPDPKGVIGTVLFSQMRPNR